jgi:hypothetical protein
VALSDAERDAARTYMSKERGSAPSLRTQDGRVLRPLSVLQVVDAAGSRTTWSSPVQLDQALRDTSGPVQLIIRTEAERMNRTSVGGIVAMSGGGVSLFGVLTVASAALIAGPSNDTSKMAVAGGVTLAVGTGIAIIGGILAAVEYASRPKGWVTVEAGDVVVNTTAPIRLLP